MAASQRTPWLVAAAFERRVQIWDVNSRSQISEFNTIFRAGAKNLAIHPSARSIVVGRSGKSGRVDAHLSADGSVLWQHTRLTYPSHLKFNQSGDQIFVTVGDPSFSVRRIEASSGTILETYRGTYEVFEQPQGNHLTVPHKTGHYLLAGRFRIERLSSALLDVAFSPDCLCLSEAGSAIRCFEYDDGQQRWRFDPEPGSHALKLQYNQSDGYFYAVIRHFAQGLFRRLERIDPKTGTRRIVCELKSWDEVFVSTGAEVVTSAGAIISLTSGEVTGSLLFPQREYPDGAAI